MNLNRFDLMLYAVTDRKWSTNSTLIDQVECAIKGGVTCVQLREKNLDDANFLDEAIKMNALCQKYNVPLFINDNVEIAKKSGANGVHIGQSDENAKRVRQEIGNSMILGVTVKTVEQALKAQNDGADYLGVGAVFSTSTKLDATKISLQTLQEITKAVDIPVVAIGGISLDNAQELTDCGLSGIAVISGIFASENIEETCKSFRKSLIKIVT